jgi:hypothetical protein
MFADLTVPGPHTSSSVQAQKASAARKTLMPLGDAGTADLTLSGMNAIEMLEGQHAAVERLFDELEEAKGDEKQALFDELADSLAMHAMIEERHFYPAIRDDETDDVIERSLHEHLEMKRVLAELLTLEAEDERFDAKLAVLREEVEKHFEEERDETFPIAEDLLEEDHLEALGQEMLATMAEIMQGEPRYEVPVELEHPERP